MARCPRPMAPSEESSGQASQASRAPRAAGGKQRCGQFNCRFGGCAEGGPIDMMRHAQEQDTHTLDEFRDELIELGSQDPAGVLGRPPLISDDGGHVEVGRWVS